MSLCLLKFITILAGVVPAQGEHLRHGSLASTALQVNQHIHHFGDVAGNGVIGKSGAGDSDTGAQAFDSQAGGVGMDRTKSSGMSGIQSLQQVEGFRSAHLAQEDTVRPQAQCLAEQVTDTDSRQIELLAPCFETNQIRGVDRDFRCVFDQDNALVLGQECRQSVEECRFPAAGTAADQNGLPCLDGRLKAMEDLLRRACPGAPVLPR